MPESTGAYHHLRNIEQNQHAIIRLLTQIAADLKAARD